MNKKIKIFISHSEKDKKYAEALVNLLTKIGVLSECIFCSSVPPYGVKISKNFI
ncbi:MAG: toll/interleukin-1 receptor domain-containing protein [Lachnospiraceae bacterium]|nr:toll/interleukin-1 receptor domain-containing protein [Lachnospiraceae bacterium]